MSHAVRRQTQIRELAHGYLRLPTDDRAKPATEMKRSEIEVSMA